MESRKIGSAGSEGYWCFLFCDGVPIQKLVQRKPDSFMDAGTMSNIPKLQVYVLHVQQRPPINMH